MVKTKRIILYCIFIFAINACSFNKSNKLIINGIIKNNKSQSILLYEMGFQKSKNIDISFVGDDGEFTFKIDSPEGKMYYLENEKKETIFFFGKAKDRLEIQTSYANFANYSIQGNEDSALAASFIKEKNVFLRKLNKINIAFNEEKLDEIEAEKQTDIAFWEMSYFIRKFISGSDNVYLKTLGLNFLDKDANYAFYHKTIKQMHSNYNEQSFVNSMHATFISNRFKFFPQSKANFDALNIDKEITSSDKLPEIYNLFIWKFDCHQSIFELNQLAKLFEYNDHPIVSLCLDQDFEKWKQLVESSSNDRITHLINTDGLSKANIDQFYLLYLPSNYMISSKQFVSKNVRCSNDL